MANQQLVDYIKQQLGQGISDGELRKSLYARGWSVEDVGEAFKSMDAPLPPVASSEVKQSAVAQERDSAQNPSEKVQKAKGKGCLFWGLIIFGMFGVLLAILGILAAIVLVAINPAGQIKKARDADRQFSATTLQKSVEQYRVIKGSYPSKLEDLVPSFMDEVPVDTLTQKPFDYSLNEEGSDYSLCVDFEERDDECLTSEKRNFSTISTD